MTKDGILYYIFFGIFSVFLLMIPVAKLDWVGITFGVVFLAWLHFGWGTKRDEV